MLENILKYVPPAIKANKICRRFYGAFTHICYKYNRYKLKKYYRHDSYKFKEFGITRKTERYKEGITPAIRIGKLIIRNNDIHTSFLFSEDIERYFTSNAFYITYDSDISKIDEGILYIPFISNVITIAWAVGADVYVRKLDKEYLESLNRIRPIMKRMYPVFSCSGNIYVDELTENELPNHPNAMLLFSGGVSAKVKGAQGV